MPPELRLVVPEDEVHRDPAGRQRHEEMGFHEGWGTVLDQLVEYAQRRR